MRDPIGGIDYVRAHLEEALATDPRVTEGGLHVAVDGDELVVTGSVLDAERATRRVAPSPPRSPATFAVRNETSVVALDEHRAPTRSARVIRVAAFGDCHVGADTCGRLRRHLAACE